MSGDRGGNKELFRNFVVRRGNLLDKLSTEVIPKGCLWQIPRMYHDNMGHFSFDKTLELLSLKFWFAEIQRFTRKYMQCWLSCMFRKVPGGKRPGFLHPIEKTPRPFHTIHTDHVGPFVESVWKYSGARFDRRFMSSVSCLL